MQELHYCKNESIIEFKVLHTAVIGNACVLKILNYVHFMWICLHFLVYYVTTEYTVSSS